MEQSDLIWCKLSLVSKSLFQLNACYLMVLKLTHWGRTTHICIGNLTIIGSDNDLSPGQRQAIIWTSDGILSIGHLGTNFSEILIRIQTFPFKKMEFKMSSAKWHPFCLGINVLNSCLQLCEVHITEVMWYLSESNFMGNTHNWGFINVNTRSRNNSHNLPSTCSNWSHAEMD